MESSENITDVRRQNRLYIKMPEFLLFDPEIWFSILNKTLKENGIINDTGKFTYALTAIGSKFYNKIRNIILNPPQNRSYEILKFELIKRVSSPQEEKTRHPLEFEGIVDRKPSQFLRHLRNLANNAVNDDFLRTIWINRLPNYLLILLDKLEYHCINKLQLLTLS